MDSNRSSVAWILAIEALASFNQVDTSLLIDLLKKAPKEISDSIGENAREMVSLRILESLCAQKKRMTPECDEQVGFDLTESCENVLRELLPETSGSSSRIETAMLKRDFEPFIQHKRSCLPKSALEKLKDAILDDDPLVPTSLKESSGLLTRKRSEGSDRDDHEISPSRNAKRVRNDSATENCVGQNFIMSNADDVHSDAEKDTPCSQQIMRGHNPVSFHGSRLVEDCSAENVQHTENGAASSNEIQHGAALEERNFTENINEEYVPSKRLKMSDDVNGAELLRDQQQDSRKDVEPSQDTSGEEQDQNMGVNEATDDREHCAGMGTSSDGQQATTQKTNSVAEAKDCEHSFPINALNNGACFVEAESAMDQSCEAEINKEDSGYNENNDRIYKNSFLSSPCAFSEDSFGAEDRTEQQHCIICKKGGQFLVCSSDACPRVVHESCLGVAATFDESGGFYCPFCAYSRANSEFIKSKKKYLLAKKYMASFIVLGARGNSSEKVVNQGSHDPREHKSMQKAASSVADVQISEADDSFRKGSAQLAGVDEQQEVLHQPEAGNHVDDGDLSADQREAQTVGNPVCCQSSRERVEPEISSQAVQDCEVSNSNCSGSQTVHGGMHHGATQKEQEVMNQQNTVLPRKTVKSPSTDRAQGSGEKSDKSKASHYSLRDLKEEVQFTHPAMHLLRRRKLPWTDDEEETLKQGVLKFASDNCTKMPWKTILEFGSSTFHTSRTTIDLKDKWRNICKANSKVLWIQYYFMFNNI